MILASLNGEYKSPKNAVAAPLWIDESLSLEKYEQLELFIIILLHLFVRCGATLLQYTFPDLVFSSIFYSAGFAIFYLAASVFFVFLHLCFH